MDIENLTSAWDVSTIFKIFKDLLSLSSALNAIQPLCQAGTLLGQAK
jgi:hypothetical protein